MRISSLQKWSYLQFRRHLSVLGFYALFLPTISCTRVNVDVASTAQKLSLFTLVGNQGSQAAVDPSNANLHFEGSCDARVISIKVLRADGSEADVAAIMNPGGDIDCSDKAISFDIPYLLLTNGKDFSQSDQQITFFGQAQTTETFPVVITLVPLTPAAGGGGGTGSGTGTVVSVLDSVTSSDLGIADLYPISKTWGKWVKYSSATKTFSLCGTNSSCFPGYFQKIVSVTKLSSCQDLTASDSLNIYDWSCQIKNSHVEFIGTMRPEKKLLDLLSIDAANSTIVWKQDQFILRDIAKNVYRQSALVNLFANNLVYVTGNSSGLGLASGDSGKIFVFQDGKYLDGFYSGNPASNGTPAVTVSNVSVVLQGTSIFTQGQGGASAFMLKFYKSNEFYVEGSFNLNSEISGGGALRISRSNHGVLRQMNIFNGGSGSIGVHLQNENTACVTTCTGEIFLHRNIFSQLSVGVQIEDKTTDVRIYENHFVGNQVGLLLESTTSDTLIQSSHFANNSSAGVQLDFGSNAGRSLSIFDSEFISHPLAIQSKGTGHRAILFKNISTDSNDKVFYDADGGSDLNWLMGVNYNNQNLGQTKGSFQSFAGPQLIQNLSNGSNLSDLQGQALMASSSEIYTSSDTKPRDWSQVASIDLQDLSSMRVQPTLVAMDLGSKILASSILPVYSLAPQSSGLLEPSSAASRAPGSDLSPLLDASCSLTGNQTVVSFSMSGTSVQGLLYATEITNPLDPFFQGTGNLDGVCQSNESCQYTPMAGISQTPSYLGRLSAQSCSPASISGVLLRGYSQ